MLGLDLKLWVAINIWNFLKFPELDDFYISFSSKILLFMSVLVVYNNKMTLKYAMPNYLS